MRGTITFIPPTRPMDVYQLSYVPPREWFEKMLGGPLIEVARLYDQHCGLDGMFVPAVMLYNVEAETAPEPNVNFWATAAWHLIAKFKGTLLQSHLHGNVIIVTGDGDYLAQVL